MKKMILVLVPILIAVTAQAQQRKAAPAPKMVTPSYEQPTTYSWSNGFTHELDVNPSLGYIKSFKVADKSITDLQILASYSYDFGSSVQIGADVGFRSFDSQTRITLAGTGTYNFASDYSDAFYAKGGLGIYQPMVPVENKYELGIKLGGGKRFKIWDHVNYKPEIYVMKVGSNDAEFTIQFFNISLNTTYLF